MGDSARTPRPWRVQWQEVGLDRKIELFFTFSLLLVTSIYAVVSFFQWKVSRDSFQASRAAALAFDMGGLAAIAPGEMETFTLLIENVGHLGASPIGTQFEHEIVDKDVRPALRLPPMHWSHGTIGPRQHVGYTFDIPGGKLDAATVASIDDGRRVAYVYGVVKYGDGFRRQCAEFCFSVKPPVSHPTLLGCDFGLAICDQGSVAAEPPAPAGATLVPHF